MTAPDMRPVLPEWAASRDQLVETVRFHAARHGHAAVYHGSRSGFYLVKVLAYAVRGAFRLSVRGHGWVHHQAGYEIMSAHLATGGRESLTQAAKAHSDIEATRKRRSRVAFAYAAAVLGVAVVLWKFAPWLLAVAAVPVVFVLAYHGKRAGQPMLASAALPDDVRPPTREDIADALSVLGISALSKAIADGWNGFLKPAVGRSGRGWLSMMDLPPGVTVDEVAERRDKLAAALRRPLACVWPEGDQSQHPGRLVLYLCDESLNKVAQPAWPLANAAKFSMFDPIPFGFDERLRPGSLALMYANLLVASISRMGKTQSIRNVLLAAALDPLAELHVWELKGTGDLDALEKVAHAYGSGADDETIADCLADLRKVHAELDRRAKVIKGLPVEQCPQRKVTPQLARRRGLRLHPLVFAVSECQEAFINAKVKSEFEELCLQVIRRGPALGIMLILETQRPDAKALPTAITANVAMRFCLKVMDQIANDMILGTSAYKRGINATMFAFEDKGIGWAVGFGPEPQIMKTFDIDGTEAEQISRRALAGRQAAGTLTGQAQPVPDRDVLADVAAVLAGDTGLHWQELADRLAGRFPDRWADVTGAAISEQCRALDVPSVDVTRARKTLKGCRASDVDAARQP